jgi:NitT/TauT family transport system permease protein
MKILKTILPPLAPFVVITATIEVLVRGGLVKSYILPAPSAVLKAVVENRERLAQAMLKTSGSALLGFALSTLAGIAIAVLLSSSRWIERAFYPYAVFFQTVPIIAIAPLLVIWFGYGTQTVVASAFVVSIFPVIANTLTGILSTDPALIDLFRLYGATSVVTLFKLRFPAALPQILTGLRVAAGLAVIGAIVGEFIGGGGLGSMVDVARTQQRIDLVFAAVLLASVLGLALFGLINLIGRLTLGAGTPPSNNHVSGRLSFRIKPAQREVERSSLPYQSRKNITAARIVLVDGLLEPIRRHVEFPEHPVINGQASRSAGRIARLESSEQFSGPARIPGAHQQSGERSDHYGVARVKCVGCLTVLGVVW